MTNIINHLRALYFLFLICIAFVIQQSRIFEYGGINPNLVMLVFLVFIFHRRLLIREAIIISVGFLLFSVQFSVSWAIAIFISFLMAMFIRRLLTGNIFLDFIIVLVVLTPVFYVISECIFNILHSGLNFVDFHFVFSGFILNEIIYNLLFGITFWILSAVLSKSPSIFHE